MDGVFTCNIMGVFQKYKLSYNWLEKDKFKPFEGFFFFIFYFFKMFMILTFYDSPKIHQPNLHPPPPFDAAGLRSPLLIISRYCSLLLLPLSLSLSLSWFFFLLSNLLIYLFMYYYYICGWKLRKCGKLVVNLFSIAFS